MSDSPQAPMSEARERVLNVAEALFTERGYAAVTLKDVAKALGMQQASLYYHVPGGKEALFIEVTERGLNRHRLGLEDVMAEAGPDLGKQLNAAARWLLAQPAIDFGRMMKSDMPAINDDEAQRLANVAYESLLEPIGNAFRRAYEDGETRMASFTSLAGAFLSIVEGIHMLPDYLVIRPREELARELIDVLLNGLIPR